MLNRSARVCFAATLGLLGVSCWVFSATATQNLEVEEYPLGRGSPGFALLAGGSFMQIGNGWDAGPMVGLRYYFPKQGFSAGGPEALSAWSLELGGTLPHKVPLHLTETVQNAGTTYNQGAIETFAEEHLAVQYRWAVRRPVRMNPDVSLGVSFAQIGNTFKGSTLNSFSAESQNTRAIGPLARIGLSLLANDWFAFRLEGGYSHFANTVSNQGFSFDLDVSGFAIYPSLQVSIGYLQPGVEKGVYVQPESLPLWVLSALQTEKRSPIIAPPEVLMNARQTAAQGGLSGNVLFQYKNKGAHKVELLADFNQWKPEPLYMDQAHVWITVRDLPAGTYYYTFLVNGKREVRDPWNSSFDPSQRTHGSSVFAVQEVAPAP